MLLLFVSHRTGSKRAPRVVGRVGVIRVVSGLCRGISRDHLLSFLYAAEDLCMRAVGSAHCHSVRHEGVAFQGPYFVLGIGDVFNLSSADSV